MSTVTTLIQCRTGRPTQHSKARKRNKKHIDWKAVGNPTTLFADEMIVYVKNPKESAVKPF